MRSGMHLKTLNMHTSLHACMQVWANENAHTDAQHTHRQRCTHMLRPGCVAVGAVLSISSPALTAYPGLRREGQGGLRINLHV